MHELLKQAINNVAESSLSAGLKQMAHWVEANEVHGFLPLIPGVDLVIDHFNHKRESQLPEPLPSIGEMLKEVAQHENPARSRWCFAFKSSLREVGKGMTEEVDSALVPQKVALIILDTYGEMMLIVPPFEDIWQRGELSKELFTELQSHPSIPLHRVVFNKE